ncbi:hypothetical protein JGH11_16980 [Dysgonomonas sp. Marseille-P4677]|uniref:hypothetical protein n=1 Tax=Dysgonomonas sp. Marseille-P4677 TaxID=2364790 RepID=UPI0019132CB4|nr:hypothetical protein [Dysgonomonas sp. Marseille-P4677]MBK5722570.1 hypothetical protein [Dysgonomonas sp. Marseille-P4677]
MTQEQQIQVFKSWQTDWNKFVRDVLNVRLDSEQRKIIESVQFNPMTTVASGTSRGKDFVSACACLCFLYLTPKFNNKGDLIENTKVFMTAPTGRQIQNIMIPEISKLLRRAKGVLPGRRVSNDIRTEYEEWFLSGFKADDNATEAWTGLHASNIMFAITEGSGISETIFNAIEGNLQGNSRMLIVFNPNVTVGYAARSMKNDRFAKFRLNSLDAENVKQRKKVISGQVNHEWVDDKVKEWCQPIRQEEMNLGEGDFEYHLPNENGILIKGYYRPNDLFRIKILGMFPRVAEDVLIPYEWIELANKRWLKVKEERQIITGIDRFGVDVAGMGRDQSVICHRRENFVASFSNYQSQGNADHMYISGITANLLNTYANSRAYIDTIGEGAGVYSRLAEQGFKRAFSAKNSESAKGLNDITGNYTFANMRAYLFWCVRDWLNPINKTNACLPMNDRFAQQATEIKWKFRSDGSIIIEPKEDIRKRIDCSTDEFDALSMTFYPDNYDTGNIEELEAIFTL